MSINFLAPIGAFLVSAGLAGHAHCAPIVLTKPVDDVFLRVHQVSKIADGKLCIVGGEFDVDAAKTRNAMYVVDMVKQQVVWKSISEAPDDLANADLQACRSDGAAIYAVGNVHTSSFNADSATLTYVYKFDLQGKLIATKAIEVKARHAMPYDIEVSNGSINVVGSTFDLGKKVDKHGVYFAKLDRALKNARITLLASGAYEMDAAARMVNDTVYFAGKFLQASAAPGGLDDYAVSKIGPNRKYQFSIRPGASGQSMAAISAGGEIVYLAVNNRIGSYLGVISQDGKSGESVALEGPTCHTTSLGADGERVVAVRECPKSKTPQVVAINRKSGAITDLGGVAGEAREIYAIDGSVYVLSEKAKGHFLIQQLVTK